MQSFSADDSTDESELTNDAWLTEEDEIIHDDFQVDALIPV